MAKSSVWKKAGVTDKWTEILFRALAARVAKRWRFVSFRGVGGAEWRGIVDVVAIRKNTARSSHEVLKSGDLFEIVLVQMKGGSSRWPTDAELRRLRSVAEHYRAKAVVLFVWKKAQSCQFFKLERTGWESSTSRQLFG